MFDPMLDGVVATWSKTVSFGSNQHPKKQEIEVFDWSTIVSNTAHFSMTYPHPK